MSRVVSRSWLGCLNNYSVQELEQLRSHECRYMALGFHVGLKSKLPHVHIEVEYKVARAMPKFNKRIHWEKRRGTLKQALDYLNKEDKLEERGDRPKLDNNIHLSFQEIFHDAEKGIAHPDNAIYARYNNYFNNEIMKHQPPKVWDGELEDKNIWIWGDKGLGKTGVFYDLAIAENTTLYDKQFNKWWDGFGGQKYVIMEDADPDNTQYLGGFIKKWADRYSFMGEYKGGNMTIYPEYHFIITSQYHPNECFKRARDAEAVMRRFDVYHITAPLFDKRTPQVAAPPRPVNPTPPCSQTYESQTEEAKEISSNWN